MFLCYICNGKLESSNFLLRHLQSQHYSAIKNRYLCKQDNCIKEFQDAHAFKKHLDRKHNVYETTDSHGKNTNFSLGLQTSEATSFSSNSSENKVAQLSQNTYEVPTDPKITAKEFRNFIENSTSHFIAKLYNNTSIPRNVVQHVAGYNSELHGSGYLNLLKKEVIRIINKETISAEDKTHLGTLFHICENSYEQFGSEYKRFQYFESTQYFIRPQAYYLGTTDVSRIVDGIVTNVPTDIYGQSISIEAVLKGFFREPGVLEETLEYMSKLYNEVNSNYMSNIIQGELWKRIKTKYNGRILIPAMLNFDEYETNNPTGYHTGVHKMAATYILLLTLPQKYQSALKNIFLALLFYDQDRKEFGNRACFDRLIKELTKLEVEGLVIHGRRIFICCILVTGDSLGIHEICGLVKSFSANYPCRVCKITKEELHRQITEDPNLIRTINDYEQDLLKDNVSQTGIEERCVWNDLPSFHILSNAYFDVFHDFWEGAVPYDMSALILHYIEQKFFSLGLLNDRIMGFNFGPVDKGNLPSHLSKEKLLNKKLGFSGSETMTFLKYFGLLIGDRVPEDDEHWQLYTSLRNISDILTMRIFDRGCIALLKTLITEHHQIYIRLFGESLKPKHHFLLHYPRIIDRIGPLLNIWCMRTEAKHRPSKRTAHISQSRINLPYTLATKHQLQLSYTLMTNDSFNSPIEYGHEIVLDQEFLLDFQPFLPVTFQTNSVLYSVPWIRINNIIYKPSMVVMVNYENQLPVFSSIVEILVNAEKHCAFIGKRMITKGLCSRVCAYEVTFTSDFIGLTVENLFNKFPTFVQHSAHGQFFVIYNDS